MGDIIFRRLSPRCVDETVELLGLTDARPAATPAITDRRKRALGVQEDPELTEEEEEEEESLHCSVVGELLGTEGARPLDGHAPTLGTQQSQAPRPLHDRTLWHSVVRPIRPWRDGGALPCGR